ncbi:uncharacterized protein LOC101859526 [Aplysia californica]|uniref:Uncharacterized protein LOC101859526 n=1 Tax=Aplysia californica TaxID=6500 RepID=A0ABM1ACP4_APLCA|nr:uncharacterized protein LOC101859526 [Aplysia californica]
MPQNSPLKQNHFRVQLTPPVPWINPAGWSAHSVPVPSFSDIGHQLAENMAPEPAGKRRRIESEPSPNGVESRFSGSGLRPFSSSQSRSAGDISGGYDHVSKMPMETQLWFRLREQALREKRDNLLHNGTVETGAVDWEKVQAVTAPVFSLVGAFVANFQEEFYTDRFSLEERVFLKHLCTECKIETTDQLCNNDSVVTLRKTSETLFPTEQVFQRVLMTLQQSQTMVGLGQSF